MAVHITNKMLFLILFVQVLSVLDAKVIELNENNWHQMLEGEWMVEFYAPWCPACKALQPIWDDFSSWSDDLEISVGQVDVTVSPGLSGRFIVTALPTIYHVKDGVFRQYRGSRDKQDFLTFIEDKKWMEVEEIPTWKSPASIQMSVVSQFFKLSMVLRSVHSVLVEEWGLPTWGSYLVFALGTIVIGALLGLIFVCIIDFMFPPKTCGSSLQSSTPESKAADEEEDLNEDAEDESQDEKDGNESQADSQDEEANSQDESQNEEVSDKEDEGTESKENSTSSPSVRKRRARKD